MQLPMIRGLIDRRILVNYRVKRDVLERMLPAPFRPKCIKGVGVAGICLIRLKQIRPRFVPAFLGLSSENAAHRIAVEWDDVDGTREGVFISRRDTSSTMNTIVGGRLFPVVQNHAQFQVHECQDQLQIEATSDDRKMHLLVSGQATNTFSNNSVFGSLNEASRFFECGSVGYSVNSRPGHFDGIELRSLDWHVRSLDITTLKSSFFDNHECFPVDSIEFDCALLMEGIEHEWHRTHPLCPPTFAPGKPLGQTTPLNSAQI